MTSKSFWPKNDGMEVFPLFFDSAITQSGGFQGLFQRERLNLTISFIFQDISIATLRSLFPLFVSHSAYLDTCDNHQAHIDRTCLRN